MINAKVNSNSAFTIEHDELNDKYSVNGTEMSIDMIKLNNNAYHVLKNNKSYNVEILAADHATKTFTIKINNDLHKVELKDRYDELLSQLGFDKMQTQKVNDVKAPMPGLVKNILVSEGQEIKTGDSVVILEAMKMENVLKSASDAIVKSIKVKIGATVEKNEVMVILG